MPLGPLLTAGKAALPYIQGAAAVTGVVGALSRLRGQPAENLKLEILKDQLDWRSRLQRRSSGMFTPAEIREIREGAEPQVNRVAGNVAQRGLGTSGSGAAVIQEAQQAPFDEAQRVAAFALSDANEAAFNLASMLTDSDSFNEDLGTVVKNLTLLEELVPEGDSVADGVFSTLRELYVQWKDIDGAFGEAFYQGSGTQMTNPDL